MRLSHARLADWADRRLIPGVILILIVGDLFIGLNWLLSPPQDLVSPAYDVGKQVWSMSLWGTLLLILTMSAMAAMVSEGRRFIPGYLFGPLIGGFWLVWLAFFTLGTWGTEDGASFYNSITAGVASALHLLVGLAITKRPAVPLPSHAIR